MTPFEVLQLKNPIVASILRYGGTAEDCAVALAGENARLMARIAELESLAPRRVRLPNGNILLWRAPDEAAVSLFEEGRATWMTQ